MLLNPSDHRIRTERQRLGRGRWLCIGHQDHEEEEEKEKRDATKPCCVAKHNRILSCLKLRAICSQQMLALLIPKSKGEIRREGPDDSSSNMQSSHGAVARSIHVNRISASPRECPHMSSEGRKALHTAGRSGLPKSRQR